jgi:ATP-dependent Lon protease
LTNEEGIQARVLALKQQASKAIELLPEFPAELAAAVQSIESPGALSDLIAGFLDIPSVEKQKLLETFDIRQRLETVAEYMAKRLAIIERSRHIEGQPRF